MVRQWNLSNHFASNTQKILPRSYFCWRHAIKNSRGQMRQISRRMEMIHPTIGWRRDENGTHKHAHGSWILWFISRVCSKTMHSLSYITSWLPYISLCYIDSRFFLPLEQSHTALLGCRLAASRLPEAARWQLVAEDTSLGEIRLIVSNVIFYCLFAWLLFVCKY